MKRFLALVLCAAQVAAAELTLPDKYQGWWTPHTAENTVGVGVPGGFIRFTAGQAEDRAVTGNVIDITQAPYLADNTGVNDATAAINSALSASLSGDVIYAPAGDYKVVGTIAVGMGLDNRTFRGAGPTTRIVAGQTTNQTVFAAGTLFNSWEGNPLQTVTGTKTKGVTTLNVTTASLFTVGVPAVVSMSNEIDNARIEAGAAPTFSSGGNISSPHRKWVVMITARDTTANTVTIEPPLLVDSTNYTLSIAPGDSPTNDLRYFGLESMSFVNASGFTYHKGATFGRALYCWLYDVSFDYQGPAASGGPTHWSSGYRNEISKNTFTGTPIDGESSFSDGAIQWQNQTSTMIEDNAFVTDRSTNTWGWDVGIYSDGNTSHCVIAYNFFEQGHKNILINHTGGHSLLNLIEGNLGQRVQHDGYFSSTSHHTLWGNWFSGRNASGNAHPFGGYTSWFKRFSREFYLGANVWGWDGLNASAPQYGYPNTGNDAFTGTAQPTLGDFWDDWPSYIAGTYSGGPGGFQEKDLDVEPSFTFVHNYQSSLTTGAVENPTGDTLPASMFRTSKPDYFGDLSWPPFNVNAPAFDYAAIPAGYRYINGNEDYLGGVSTPQYSPSPGTYGSSQEVTITSATPSATIYYTTDGSTPTTGSTLYTGPVTISATSTLKAIAVKAELTDSSVQSGTYTISIPGVSGNATVIGTTTVTGTLTLP